MTTRGDWLRVLRACKAKGYEVQRTGRGSHVKIVDDDGTVLAVLSTNPSTDWRASRNTRAALRKIGVDL